MESPRSPFVVASTNSFNKFAKRKLALARQFDTTYDDLVLIASLLLLRRAFETARARRVLSEGTCEASGGEWCPWYQALTSPPAISNNTM